MKVASNAEKKSASSNFKAYLEQKTIDTTNQYFTCIDTGILITALWQRTLKNITHFEENIFQSASILGPNQRTFNFFFNTGPG